MDKLNNFYLFFEKNKKPSYIVIITLLFFLPFVVDNYILHISILLGVYLVLGISLNTVAGLAGELDLGHAAFFGIGAYVSSIFVINFFNSFLIGTLLAGSVSLLFGLLLGVPSLRIRGDYLCIVTLGFNEIIRYIFLNWQNVTNGPMGIRGIPMPTIFGITISTKQYLFYLISIILVLTFIVMNRISNSMFGRALAAIRENEIAAASLGINTGFYKIWAFAITASFAGIAGSFFAHYMNFINPNNFNTNESILILCMVVIGGKGSIFGSIVGVSILYLLPEILRPIAAYRMLIYGILIVAMMIFRPNGFMPEKRKPSKIERLILNRR